MRRKKVEKGSKQKRRKNYGNSWPYGSGGVISSTDGDGGGDGGGGE